MRNHNTKLGLLALGLTALPGLASAVELPWAAAATLGSGTSPSGVRIGDLDHDGDNDVAVTYASSEGLVGYLGNAGVFTASTLYAPGSSYTNLLLVDIDNNGTLDAAVGNTAATWAVVTNDGAGVFSLAATGDGGADAITAFDSDLDGDIDLYSVTATAIPGPGYKGLFQHGNSGTIPTSALLLTEATESYTDVAHGDFDGDGDDDIVYVTDARIRVMTGNRGDANSGGLDFDIGGDLAFLNGAQNVIVADIDGDLDLDIVVSSNGGSGDAVVWYANGGSANFGAAQTIAAGASDVNKLSIGDVDSDGDIDVLIARDSGLAIAENTGAGASWSVNVVSSTLSEVADAVFGDIDNDGDIDIAAVSAASEVAVWFENLELHRTLSWDSVSNQIGAGGLLSPQRFDMGDIDGDGDLDFVGNDDGLNPEEAFWYENLGGATSWGGKNDMGYGSMSNSRQSIAVDLDRNGTLDFVNLANNGSTNLRWSTNDGTGVFTPQGALSGSSNTSGTMHFYDMDNDGDLDVVRGRNSGQVRYDRNPGDPTQSWQGCNPASFTNSNDTVAGDIDGDGDGDIVIAANGGSDNGIYWLQYTPDGGCGTWAEIAVTAIGSTNSNGNLSLGDIDQDGDLDIVGRSTNTLTWWENPGTTATGWSPNTISTTYMNATTLGDFDRDGDIDVLTSSGGNSGEIVFLENEFGFGSSWTETTLTVGDADSMRPFDLNGDGIPDAVYELGTAFGWSAGAQQQAGATSADLTSSLSVTSAPSNISDAIEEGTGDEVLSITLDHTFGRTDDVGIELGTLDLFLHDGAGIPLSDADAGNALTSIEIWRDSNGDGEAGGADVFLTDVTSFTLAAGVLSIDVPSVTNGDVVAGATGDYLVFATIAGTAVANGFTTLGIDHVGSDALLIEYVDTDITVPLDGSPAGVSNVVFTIAPLDSDDDGDPDTTDCNTLDDTIYDGAAESCDGVDEDCDGSIDEDFDGDSDGAFDGAVTACLTEYGAAVVDCDDSAAAINPSATEICDIIDNDCDSSIDEGFDVDTDTYTSCGADGITGTADDDCDDDEATTFPGATESCDFVDSNCDGDLVDTFTNSDTDTLPDCIDTDDDNDGAPDGGAPGVADCADTDPTIYPGATELCDNIDSNCDGDLVDTFTNSDTDALPDCVDLDDDDDGMLDSCEIANSLDPLDSADAVLDPDLDGRTNLDECTLDTDPASYDGPDAPANVTPLPDEVIVSGTPPLTVTNATSPLGDTLTYAFEAYDDAALTSLVANVSGSASGASTTTWNVTPILGDDTVIYWRAAASDAFVQGPWSAASSFLVDTKGEAPSVPEHTFPLLGQTMRAGEETLEWMDSTSPEGLELEYDVQLWDSGALTMVASGVVEGTDEEVTEEWLVDVALTEGLLYSWRVRSRDPAGRTSVYSDYEVFGYETANAPPTDPAFISPLDDAEVGTVSPLFRMNASVDVEGGMVTHLLELDTVGSFDSADLITFEPQSAGAGEVEVDLLSIEDEPVELVEDIVWFARVSSMDIEGLSSAPDIISFFVRGDNAAPPTPELISPAPSEVTEELPTLVVTTVADPEGDVVTYEFAVGSTADLSGVAGVSSGTRELQVSTPLAGGYYWTVRAVDSEGARSDWAEARYAVAVDPTWGSCSTVGNGAPSALWLLLPLGVLLRRRRS